MIRGAAALGAVAEAGQDLIVCAGQGNAVPSSFVAGDRSGKLDVVASGYPLVDSRKLSGQGGQRGFDTLGRRGVVVLGIGFE